MAFAKLKKKKRKPHIEEKASSVLKFQLLSKSAAGFVIKPICLAQRSQTPRVWQMQGSLRWGSCAKRCLKSEVRPPPRGVGVLPCFHGSSVALATHKVREGLKCNCPRADQRRSWSTTLAQNRGVWFWVATELCGDWGCLGLSLWSVGDVTQIHLPGSFLKMGFVWKNLWGVCAQSVRCCHATVRAVPGVSRRSSNSYGSPRRTRAEIRTACGPDVWLLPVGSAYTRPGFTPVTLKAVPWWVLWDSLARFAVIWVHFSLC